MSNSSGGDAIGCLIIIAAVFWGIPWVLEKIGVILPPNEATVYVQKYTCLSPDNSHCLWEDIGYIKYKVSFELQSVVIFGSKNPWTIERLDNCIVADVDNWVCGIHEKIGFSDGEFSTESNQEYRYFSRLSWWFNKI